MLCMCLTALVCHLDSAAIAKARNRKWKMIKKYNIKTAEKKYRGLRVIDGGRGAVGFKVMAAGG